MKLTKKAAIAAASAVAMLQCAVPAAALGDVNKDASVSIADAVLLIKHLGGVEALTAEAAAEADMDSDGAITAADLTLLKRELLNPTVQGNEVIVTNIEELFVAMRGAKPLDIIKVAPGTYDYTVYQGAQKIDTTAAGEEGAPITLTALDPENPPVITGTSSENGYVLHIKGDYWDISHLRIQKSQKGIVFDNSSHSVISDCEVYEIGAEAIALRDGSSYNLVENCYIHDTGLVSPGFGEGVYIGSAYSTTGFDYKCDYNTVKGCTFKNVAAEHIDVKEYTTGTEIYGCTFYGDGMTGANFAGSFVDIAGNDCHVHDNIGYRNGNVKIVAAFELHEQIEGWGYGCSFQNNTVYMDQPYGAENTERRMYVVDGWFSDFAVYNNMVDYGEGLFEAQAENYNSDYVVFLNEATK